MINTIQRSNFIHHHLQPLCKALDNEIVAMTYGNVGDVENVYIVFIGGYKAIDVSGLNPREIALVVLDSIDYIEGEE